MMTVRTTLSLASTLLLVCCLACGSGKGEKSKDAAADHSGNLDRTGADVARAVPLPELVRDCTACHTTTDLTKSLSNETAGPREWVSDAATGLLRDDPAIPSASVSLKFEWPSRGRHPEEALEPGACAECHPVDDNGLGHGVRTFPPTARTRAFEGGKSCGQECHAWLNEEVTAAGFVDVDGKTPEYTGSLRPSALLGAVETAHTKLWQSGSVPDPELEMKIAHFNPGCGGCHHVASESHGYAPGCTDCHRFIGKKGKPLHENHVLYVMEGQAEKDRDGSVTACGYCHMEEAGKTRGNAACYNCHLSGHQPLDGNGRPHFW